jgi:hypothetical protein
MTPSILTRSRFAGYDPEVWVIQTYLRAQVRPRAHRRVWGSKTMDAAIAFRLWQGFEPAADLTKAAIVTEDFWTYLDREVASAGFDINIMAPTSMPGGSGTGIAVRPPTTVTPTPVRPEAQTGEGGFPVLALAAVGLGAVIAFGGKKKGRR